MDLHKLLHDTHLVLNKGGHLHLPLFAGLFGIIRNRQPDLLDVLSDLGDLGDNVPATLIESLSSRRKTLYPR